MRDRTKSECRRIRKTLQELHDAGDTPRGHAAEHLLGCRDCAAFEAFLADLSRGLRGSLDESTARLLSPDYERLFANPSQRRMPPLVRRIAIPAVAALVAAAIAIPSLFLALSAARESAAMQKAMTMFVDDLFLASSAERVKRSNILSDSSTQDLDSLVEDLAEE
jgi:hypothetical protein